MKRSYLCLYNKRALVERRTRTLMEAARTMLIFAKAPLFLWAEAVATACYTLNRSLVHTLHGKTYYELLKGKKPNLQYFRVFGSLCYPKPMTTMTLNTARSTLVRKDLDPHIVPPTKEQNANGSPSTTVISEGAPAVTESLLPHQVPLPDTSDSDIETLFERIMLTVMCLTPIMLLKPIQKHLLPNSAISNKEIQASLRAFGWIELMQEEFLDEYGDVLEKQSSLVRKQSQKTWSLQMDEKTNRLPQWRTDEVVYVFNPEDFVEP
ncbi:retrovirus-related pol polyprotein from transposon TNT 1-94 [Tanacetum coccineum]|uniref:Retrovirus-related pol polyprotein from transposon TNT 1-94 n=1 Tax=Tanacetum coccineum TaxID=301880 RepID=A0ABQ5F746_9ASTR